MSAECDIHGCDLVYDGPRLFCAECKLEAQIAILKAEVAFLKGQAYVDWLLRDEAITKTEGS